MIGLPSYEIGTDIVVEERWHGLLWSAVPHRVIHSSAEMLIGWVPTGTRSVHATNRGLPEAAGLTRDQRKLLALRTCRAEAAEFVEAPGKLSIFGPDRWWRITLGFDPRDGGFLGWYVDFQLPVEPTPDGLVTKDLVLDLWIRPDRSWKWKDRSDLETAITEGIIDPGVGEHLDQESVRILTALDQQDSPFTAELTGFVPDPQWPAPTLPPTHAVRGSAWTLPARHERPSG